MVRVAGLHDQLDAGAGRPRRRRDRSRRADRRDPRAGRSRSERGSSAASATRSCRRSRSTGSGSSRLRRRDRRGARRDRRAASTSSVFPALTPLVDRRSGGPFPYISNLSLSLRGASSAIPVQGTEVIARVKVPKELLGRFLPIGDGNDVRAARGRRSPHNLEALFPGMEVLDHALLPGHPRHRLRRLRRGRRPAARRSRRRSAGAASARWSGSRSTATSSHGCASSWSSLLGIDDRSGLRRRRLIGMDDLFDVAGVSGFGELRYPPFSPVTQTRLQRRGGAVDRPVRGDPRGRHPRPPSL